MPPSDDSPTRATLLLAVRSADRESWERFFSLYYPIIFSFARRKGLTSVAAEDIAQKCLVTVFEHHRTLEYDPARGRFRSFLFRIAANHIRAEKCPKQPLDSLPPTASLIEDPDPGPDVQFDQIWMQEHLRAALNSLKAGVSTRDFTAFARYCLEGRSPTEVCEEFAITKETLYKLKWRMLQRLRTEVQSLLGEEPDDL